MDELKFEDDNEQAEYTNPKKKLSTSKAIFALILLAIIAAIAYFTLFDKNSENLQKITQSPIVQEATNSLNSLISDKPTPPASPATPAEPSPTEATESPISRETLANNNQTSDLAQNATVNPNSLASTLPAKTLAEDNLPVMSASDADKFTIEKNTTPPPPLYSSKKDALSEELLRTETTPTTSQSLSQTYGQSEEFRQGINNDELGLGDFGQQQDSIVSIHFIDNFAKWLVNSYKPGKNSKGKTSATLQSANFRYGTNFTGLNYIENNASDGRLSILKYVYSPGMINALYRLYGTRFLDAMAYASQERKPALSPAEVEDMYSIYANYLTQIGKCLNSLVMLTELSERIDSYNARNNSLIMANNSLSKLLHSLDQAVENNNAEQERLYSSQLKDISQAYNQAQISRNNYKNALIKEVRSQDPSLNLDDDTVFFLSLWVDRRLRTNPNATDATKAAAELCLDLAAKLNR